MKILALIVLGLWVFGSLGYWQGTHGPRTDDFGQAVFVWGVLALALLLTVVLVVWMAISGWPL